VHPRTYGQQPEVEARFDQMRDQTDWRLLTEAERHGLPVLGICRGAQLINIHRGGSLCQNVTPLRVHTRHRPLLLPLQTVRVVRGTLLGKILLGPTIGANRIHSQAIKRLGRSLRVVAIDNDYFVQAFESARPQWLLGVQWHPEYLLYHPLHRRIFECFVHAVRQHKIRRLGHSEGPVL
jgi:putative glutamine amidotransferase